LILAICSGFFLRKNPGAKTNPNNHTSISRRKSAIKMNNPSPLVPQGSVDKTQGRARVKIAVSFVLAVHGIGLVALLLAACRQQQASTDLDSTPSQAETAGYQTPTNDPSITTPEITGVATNTSGTNYSAQATVQTEQTTVQDQPTNSVYTVVSGDIPYTIAKKFNVKLQALIDANPGLNPTKMRIGQKLNIPAPALATATPPATTEAPVAGSLTPSAADTYKVKSGDVLLKIAKDHGVTVKALRAANHLTTDRIRVGQTLQIPARTATGPSSATTTAPVGAMAAARTDTVSGTAQ
jgi:LysM repeat protein